MKFEGKVWKFGDDVDTDVIIPARYLKSFEPEYLSKHCMEDIRPEFHSNVKKGDIIVAGKNFGCGSSREHAPLAIKACGISAVVAKSFARIFFRNAINIGLSVIEMPEILPILNEGDTLKIDLDNGTITHIQTDTNFKISPFPNFLQQIISAGGLMNYISKVLSEGNKI